MSKNIYFSLQTLRRELKKQRRGIGWFTEGCWAGVGFAETLLLRTRPPLETSKAEDECTSAARQVKELEGGTPQSQIFSQLRSIWTKHHTSLLFESFSARIIRYICKSFTSDPTLCGCLGLYGGSRVVSLPHKLKFSVLRGDFMYRCWFSCSQLCGGHKSDKLSAIAARTAIPTGVDLLRDRTKACQRFVKMMCSSSNRDIWSGLMFGVWVVSIIENSSFKWKSSFQSN